MAKLTDYAEELVTEVGPRPFGTQQEQEAADMIAARFAEFGLDATVEEFSCGNLRVWVKIAYLFLGVVAAEMLFFMPKLHIVSLILAILAVALLVLDVLDLNPLYSMFKDSLSQNVIARYVPPGMAASSRNRKIVLVAHYDSARVRVQAMPLLGRLYGLIRLAVGAALAAVLLLAALSFAPLPEIVQLVLKVLVCVAGVIIALYLLAEVANRLLPYNAGANCNAAGVAALYGVALRLAGKESGRSGSVREGRLRSGSRRSSAADGAEAAGAAGAAGIAGAAGAGDFDATGGFAAADPNSTGNLRGARSRRSEGRSAVGGAAAAAGTAAAAEADADLQPGVRRRRAAGDNALSSADQLPPASTGADAHNGANGSTIRSGVVHSRAPRPIPEELVAPDGRTPNTMIAPEHRLSSVGDNLVSNSLPTTGAGVGTLGTVGSASAMGAASAAAGQAGAAVAAGAAGAGAAGAAGAAGHAAGNRFVSQRPPLSEIEERNRQLAAERERIAEQERQKILELGTKRNADGTPEWFTKAREAAGRKNERKQKTEGEEPQIVRSRYADMPIVGEPVPKSSATRTPTSKDGADKPTSQPAVSSATDQSASGATDHATDHATRSASQAAPAASGSQNIIPGDGQATLSASAELERLAAAAPAPAPDLPELDITSESVPLHINQYGSDITAAAGEQPTSGGTSYSPLSVSLPESRGDLPTNGSLSAGSSQPVGSSLPTSSAQSSVSATTAQRPGQPEVAPADLTGLDRQAFKVVSASVESNRTLIVPVQEGDEAVAQADRQRNEQRSRLRDLPSFSSSDNGPATES
ncbi:MAG: hypothetical protein LBR39_03875, partial [Coriobacteriales bacterium]|nr:hypothetical protein [Coriobacteriales bacterium]